MCFLYWNMQNFTCVLCIFTFWILLADMNHELQTKFNQHPLSVSRVGSFWDGGKGTISPVCVYFVHIMQRNRKNKKIFYLNSRFHSTLQVDKSWNKFFCWKRSGIFWAWKKCHLHLNGVSEITFLFESDKSKHHGSSIRSVPQPCRLMATSHFLPLPQHQILLSLPLKLRSKIQPALRMWSLSILYPLTSVQAKMSRCQFVVVHKTSVVVKPLFHCASRLTSTIYSHR